MGYYIRIFSPSSQTIDIAIVRRETVGATIEPENLAGDTWSSFTLRAASGIWIAEVTRDAVTTDSLAEQELAEFDRFFEDQEPKSASVWARDYLRSVKAIYAIEVNTAEIDSAGWDMLHAATNMIHAQVGGLRQADSEGFSNADGFQITWDFPESVSGKWWMAVRSADSWTTFQMDLGDPEHRSAFKAGVVPAGTRIV